MASKWKTLPPPLVPSPSLSLSSVIETINTRRTLLERKGKNAREHKRTDKQHSISQSVRLEREREGRDAKRGYERNNRGVHRQNDDSEKVNSLACEMCRGAAYFLRHDKTKVQANKSNAQETKRVKLKDFTTLVLKYIELWCWLIWFRYTQHFPIPYFQ